MLLSWFPMSIYLTINHKLHNSVDTCTENLHTKICMEPTILTNNLTKTFKIPIPPSNKGILRACKQLLRPTYQEITAINKISLEINKGERVAFIGPNGAGKSTTIKILASILYPTSGAAKVLGLTPWQNRRQLAYGISTVFSQRSQLWYHLPVSDSFMLLGKIYELNTSKFQQRLNYLVKTFDIHGLLAQTTKSLSLGQRIRCELVAALLHNPKILFLDEPTIGLDITAKAIVRDLLKNQSFVEATTLLLTSHDTADMETVCDRVIIINKGEIVFDDTVAALKTKYIKKKYISLNIVEPTIAIQIPGVTIVKAIPHKLNLAVDITQTTIQAVTTAILQKYSVNDLSITDPPMEEIIKIIYAQTTK